MELIDIIPEFNLYEEFWRIYTKSDNLPPQYIAEGSNVTKSIIGEGTEIYGNVEKSVIGSAVKIGKGAVVKDSIIMNNVEIGDGAIIDRAILAEGVKIGKNVELGVGESAENTYKPAVYAFDLVTIGENSTVPDGVKIGKNTAILGETTADDYPDGILPGGGSIIREAGE
jgi:glucose-1-phosphate adenylyltransferase